MIKISTGLADAMMGNVGATAALNAASLELRIFSGPEPLTADAALANEVLLVKIEVQGGSQGMRFTNTSGGVITKDIDQSWLGNVLNTGVPTYYRLCQKTDDNSASTTKVRVQGSVGVTGDLKLGTTTLATGNPQSIDFYQLRLPQYLGA